MQKAEMVVMEQEETRADRVFGPIAVLRPVADVHASSDAQQKFVSVFVYSREKKDIDNLPGRTHEPLTRAGQDHLHVMNT